MASDGRVTYLTEGVLRALHRRVSTALPPYAQLGPYHSFLRADAALLQPGQVSTLSFDLYATSIILRQGHRLRVAIAGADANSFARYPAEARLSSLSTGMGSIPRIWRCLCVPGRDRMV